MNDDVVKSTGEPVHAQPPQAAVAPTPVPNALEQAQANFADQKEEIKPEAAAHVSNDKVKLAKPKLPKKEKDSSVTMAIFATVIIVFGLAALAVMAYMQSKK
ncbi:MAG: hypothetical protein ACHQT9_04915 [Candidatus Saccharimonadales bacterium]